MTNIYRTQGSLTNPVNDFFAAREYLTSDDMTQYVSGAGMGLETVVAHIRWSLEDAGRWYVEVVTNRPLEYEESLALSEWISGQNSDGLGEGFEQQPFAEHFDTDAYGNVDEESYCMSSFDWQDNRCPLTLVK